MCIKPYRLISVLHQQYFPLALLPKGTMYWEKEAYFYFFLEAEKSLKTLTVHSPRVLGLTSIGIELSIKMDTSSTPSGSLRISFLVFFTP